MLELNSPQYLNLSLHTELQIPSVRDPAVSRYYFFYKSVLDRSIEEHFCQLVLRILSVFNLNKSNFLHTLH